MPRLNSLEAAKQGSAEAIAALINSSLKPKGITAKVVLQQNCLKVLLESVQLPTQQVLAPFVFKGIKDLSLDSVQTVQVYGRLTGEQTPRWAQAYKLTHASASSLVPESISLLGEEDQTCASPEIQPQGPAQTKVVDPDLEEPVDQKTLAKQGNIEAIETLLNQAIDNSNVMLKVSAEDKALRVTAQTNQLLDGPVFAQRIHQQLCALELEQFESVDIYKQKANGSNSFRLKTFALAKLEETSPEAGESNVAELTTEISGESVGVSKKHKNINQIRKKLTVIFIVIVAGFIVIRTITRLTWLLSSPTGGFGLVMGAFILWRAYHTLNPMLQRMLRED
ncbi:hypothetical protein [Leptolyngbya sp. FACHB-261]|uniref:hypothetical protein n=1 Tax=Leptolyngbya sp. FACHB-261 TaxID=2692806 RepID=UPI00168382AA|nr:hypothetical protein [Leptolyngbya sp. FACHB-261]MBD2100860.1 hypothetical protein [Leptolyngbya sp. FACHB-261]